MKISKALLAAGFLSCIVTPNVYANAIIESLKEGDAYGAMRLRYEGVSQDNAADDATALTVRTKLGYKTKPLKGLSATLEFEDSRIVGGQDEYTVGPTGFNPGEYSVIADPETTEVDQAFLQYDRGMFSAKLGRQVITMDNHRFVGHVGWRQDRQTFDAFSLKLKPVKDLSIDLAYLTKRNRIFAEAADIKSEDFLLNAGYTTPYGKVTFYTYLLEQDDATETEFDTYGLRFSGKAGSEKIKALYTIEFATQESSTASSVEKVETDYIHAEAGVSAIGITGKVGYELLGSDEGNGAFATPLATLHKFNGFADIFLGTPAQGLEDTYATVAYAKDGFKVAMTYHEFAADEATDTIDDLGDEIDITFTKSFGKNYMVGLKYAEYNAGDDAAGKVDTDKFWVWTEIKF